eukprot:g9074.t1
MSISRTRNSRAFTRTPHLALCFLLLALSYAVAQPTERPETASTCVINLIGGPVRETQGNSSVKGNVSKLFVNCTGDRLPISIYVHPLVLDAEVDTKGADLIEDAEARGYLNFKNIRSLTIADSLFHRLVGPILAPVVFDSSAGLFYNCSFSENSQARTGGIYSAGRSFMHVYDSVFKDNKGFRYGAVSTTSGCRTLFKNTQFTNNIGGAENSDTGGFVSGAVFSFQNTLTEFEGCKFTKNTASGAGAGAFTGVKRTVVKFVDCTIDGNFGASGALSLMDVSTGTLNQSQFLNNHAYGEGAAIQLTLGSSLTVTESTSQSNKGSSGVIIAHDSSDVVLENSKFTGNTGSIYGGVISSLNGGTVVIKSCNFDSNTGSFGGVVFQDRAQELRVVDSVFMANSAQFTGGAVFQKDVIETNLTGSKFEKNEGGTVGGALAQTGCGEIDWLSPRQQSIVQCSNGLPSNCKDVMIKGCSFKDNSAALEGAALFNTRCNSLTVLSTVLPTEKDSIVQEKCTTRTFEDNTGGDVKASIVLRQCPEKKSSGRKLLADSETDSTRF